MGVAGAQFFAERAAQQDYPVSAASGIPLCGAVGVIVICLGICVKKEGRALFFVSKFDPGTA